MKQMTKLENIIMSRTGCNRETANLLANDILQEVEKDLQADVAREIFEEIEQQLRGLFDFFRQDDCIRESSAIMLAISEIAKLKKKYTEGGTEWQ